MDYEAHKIPADPDGSTSPGNATSPPPSPPPSPSPSYASVGPELHSSAPAPSRMDYLDGRDFADGTANGARLAANRNRDGVFPRNRSPFDADGPTVADPGDSPFVPPDEPPEPSSSVNDASRNWAMLVGQGPTFVESVAEKDALARKAITDALVSLLRNRFTTEPLTIGLFGEWGSGKSSQVSFVKKQLGRSAVGYPNIRVIEFNAWEHEKCDNLSAALAQTVVENLINDTSLTEQWALARQLAARKRARITKAAAKDWINLQARFYQWVAPFVSSELVLAAFVILCVLLADVPSAVKGIVSAAAAWVAGWKTVTKYLSDNLTSWFKRIASGAGGGPFGLPDYGAKLGSFHEIRETLQHLVSLRVADGSNPREGEYLLIVVDDLDRCSVGTIKLVLDAVRLVTSLPRVVTMVAVDDRIAFPAVESFFEQFKGSGRDASVVARDYLAKVFNVSITLPPVPEKLAVEFIAGRLFADEHRKPAATGAAGEQVDIEAPPAEPEASSIPDGTALITAEEVNEFTRLALAIGMTNPRALWRMKQAWYLLRNMALTFDPEPSFEPWMRSLFVREAILAQPPEVRRYIDSWEKVTRRGEVGTIHSAHIPANLGDLLVESRADVATCWHFADIVLLPAAASAAR